MISSATTFYFNNLIPDYTTWRDIISQGGIVNYDDATESLFDEYCYKLLSRHYSNCNVRYLVPDAFYLELLNVYENKFKKFKRQKELIDTIQKLSDDEYRELNEMLTNMANNPNTEPVDPLKPLQYISAQSFSKQTSSKIQSYIYALNNIPTLKVYKFFKAEDDEMGFDDLFMNIQPNEDPIYYKGDDY